jgi:hypothetical protein
MPPNPSDKLDQTWMIAVKWLRFGIAWHGVRPAPWWAEMIERRLLAYSKMP